jgi:hypothetical protein
MDFCGDRLEPCRMPMPKLMSRSSRPRRIRPPGSGAPPLPSVFAGSSARCKCSDNTMQWRSGLRTGRLTCAPQLRFGPHTPTEHVADRLPQIICCRDHVRLRSWTGTSLKIRSPRLPPRRTCTETSIKISKCLILFHSTFGL